MMTRVLAKEDFTPGTLVLVHSIVPAYGVVIDVNVWKENAREENSNMADIFEECEDNNHLIPIYLFGNIIGRQVGVDEGNPYIHMYIHKYTYSNVGGNINIISSIKELETILYHMAHFFGNAPHSYIQSVESDIVALKTCLECGLSLKKLEERTDLHPALKETVNFFYEAVKKHLPNTTYTC